jgi:hypothetical protein
MADIKGVYNASSHPDVITGKRTEEEVRSCACFPLLVCERGIWQFHLHKTAPAPSILSSITVVVSYFRASAQTLTEFMLAFQVGRDRDAIITKEEFENYYANLSASIDRDDYFELMIRNAWHISGGEGWAANTTNRRVLVTHADGRQTVEEIKNDLGLRADDKKGTPVISVLLTTLIMLCHLVCGVL